MLCGACSASAGWASMRPRVGAWSAAIRLLDVGVANLESEYG
jgi:hypothetical protein